MLQNHAIDWKTLPTAVELAMVKASRQGLQDLQARSDTEPARETLAGSWHHKRLRKTQEQQAGWDSSFYRL